jgi:hypothetical protein
MEESSQLHARAALSPGKDTPAPIVQEARRAVLDAMENKISCSCQEPNARR